VSDLPPSEDPSPEEGPPRVGWLVLRTFLICAVLGFLVTLVYTALR